MATTVAIAWLLTCALIPLAVASLVTPSRPPMPLKRANPTFGDMTGMPNKELNIIQISDVFADACTLAKAGRDAAVADNLISKKYFPAVAAHNVQGVFKNIVGNDKTSGDQWDGDNKQSRTPCSEKLSKITIKPDYVDPTTKEKACINADDMAETRDGEGESEVDPTTVFCEPGLAHGGIRKGYDVGHVRPGPKAVTCDTIGDRTTWKMETLGSVLLHEYRHWWELTQPYLGDQATDFDENDKKYYGPIDTQKIAATFLPESIADSYSWFANDAFWSAECSRQFGKPQKDDDKDPNCEGTTCKYDGSTKKGGKKD